jgi:sec-independent protein translocase protein TatB
VSNIGTPEIFMVLIVALLVLGPTRLPDAARSIGKAVSEFRRVTGGFQTEVQNAMSQLEHEVKSTIHPPDAAAPEVPKPYVFEPPPVEDAPHLFPPAALPPVTDEADSGTT